MKVKWLLFNFFVPQKVLMRTPAIIKSTPKFFSVSYVLFIADFTTENINYIFRDAIQILWSYGIYALRKWWFKVMCFDMFTNFTSWFIARTIETVLCFNWRHFGSNQGDLWVISFLKPIIGIFSKTLLCSLCGVKRR